MDKNTNDNLILKTLAKLKQGASTAWEFTKNKVVPYIVAGGIVLTMAACTPKNTDTNTNQTDSSWTDSTGSTNDSDLSTDSSTDSSTDTTKPEEDKLSQYSPLVREMLQDEYYTRLMLRAKNDKTLYSSPLFDPHPYAFLEEQGHDVAKVKSGELRCKTLGFTNKENPNDLYLATYVENTAGYYTEYFLKYSLTDKEMEDYKSFNSLYGSSCYIQSMFLNDWISANKTASILSEMKVEVNTHDYIANYLSNTKEIESLVGGSNYVDFVLTNFDSETRFYDILIFPKGTTYNAVTLSGAMCYLPMFSYEDSEDCFKNEILTYAERSTIMCPPALMANAEVIKSTIYNGQYFALSYDSAIDISEKN